MHAIAQAQPNIALIKYWGKRDPRRNLPAVGSLSITLDALWTRMSVEFDGALPRDRMTLNGEAAEAMIGRVSRCLDLVAGSERPRASVRSECNFPVAAGLASSSSAFAALVVAAANASALDADTLSLARLAGAASGSAARSLYGGFVLLTPNGEIDVRSLADDWPLEVVIAITDEAAKPIGSGEAMMRSARTSPFYSAWVARQAEDLAVARDAVERRDFERLAAVSEHNCLKMHSVMWASRPPAVFWNRATLACLQAVRELQAAGQAVFFTIDAGPQVKAVCLPSAATAVADHLAGTEGVRRVLRSGLGCGARRVAAA